MTWEPSAGRTAIGITDPLTEVWAGPTLRRASTPSPDKPVRRGKKRWRIADLFTLGVILIISGSQLFYMIVDVRAPRDLGRYYALLPEYYAELDGVLSALRCGFLALLDPGGWYNFCLAVYLKIVGRGSMAFQFVDLFWLTAIVILAAAVARKRAGRGAGLIAAALTGTCPMLIVLTRVAWIHVPETALVFGALLAWLYDPALARKRTLAVLMLLGALTIQLRPTGFIWIGTMGIAMLVAIWRPSGAPAVQWPRLCIVAGAWIVASIPNLLNLKVYLAAKLAVREVYMETVPGIQSQLMDSVGLLLCIIGFFGLFLAMWPPFKRGTFLLLSWILIPVLLFAMFRAGLDNFIPGAIALAVLAGIGMAPWPGYSGAAALSALLIYTVPQWTPPPQGHSSFARQFNSCGRFFGLLVMPSIQNHYRAYSEWGETEVIAMMDAVCPQDPSAPCAIASDQGLFLPYGEEPGDLELFLSGRDQVEIINLTFAMIPEDREQDIRAMSHFRCDHLDSTWRFRHPKSLANYKSAIGQANLEEAWSIDYEKYCTYVWYTPDGQILNPDKLPSSGVVATAPETPEAP